MPPWPTDDLARRVTALETQPHPFCPSPLLAARVDSMEDWQRRTNGSVEALRTDVADGRKERYEQVEKMRIDLASQVDKVDKKIDRLADRIFGAVRWMIGTVLTLCSLTVVIIKWLGG